MPRKQSSAAPALTVHEGNGAAPRSDVRDISELFAQKSTVVTIYDPRDRNLPVKRDTGFRVEIAPTWSPEAKEIKEQYRDRIRRVDGRVDLTDPAFDESLREQVIRCTRRIWQEPDSPDGILLEGKLLTSTPQDIRTLYTHPDLWWLYEDVQDAYLERDRFFGVPPKTA